MKYKGSHCYKQVNVLFIMMYSWSVNDRTPGPRHIKCTGDTQISYNNCDVVNSLIQALLCDIRTGKYRETMAEMTHMLRK